MGFNSQPGYIAFKKQTTPGTAETGINSSGIAFKIKSGTLGVNRDLLIPDPEIGGNRDITDAYLGAVHWAGDIDFYARMKHMGTLLSMVMGSSPTPTTTGGVSTYAFTTADTLPWYSIEEKVGNGWECFTYNDVKMNSLHLEAEANGFLQGTMGLLARNQVSGATPGTPGYDESPMTVGTNITITYNSVSVPVKSFSLDINNNLEDDDYRLGSFFLGDITEKRREVMAGITLRPNNASLWKQAVYGTSSATQAGGVTTKQPLVITMSTYEDIPSSSPATKYTLVITLPKAILKPVAVSPSGDDAIEHDFEIQAVRPSQGTDIMTASLKTDQATII